VNLGEGASAPCPNVEPPLRTFLADDGLKYRSNFVGDVLHVVYVI